MLDSSEQNLFGIHRYLEGVRHEAILGSVTDAGLVHDAIGRFRPDIVYHAAALKHVSLLELNPMAAVRNNALGTYTLAQAAIRHGASALVLVSTDKAVNPHSIMGASKRLAELTVAALSGPQCRMNAVRLGNVDRIYRQRGAHLSGADRQGWSGYRHASGCEPVLHVSAWRR